MKAIKQFVFKLIVVLCVISTLCCFVASTPIYADGSKVKSEDFYYSGTTKGSYTIDKGFFDKLVEALEEILDYVLGIMSMGFRIVAVGWTELMERCLTWIIEGASGVDIKVEDVAATGDVDSNDYITFESIVFNHIPFFNINVFDYKESEDYDSLGNKIEVLKDKDGNEVKDENGNTIKLEKSDISENSLINILKKTIAGWYYAFRLIAIMIMLILLIYIGIKLAIASATKEKALYKQVLFDWLVGMVMVFSIHYIILVMIYFNEILVSNIEKMNLGYSFQKVYEYGLKSRSNNEVSSTEMEMTMYDEVRTRAYDPKLTVGTTGMVMYAVLVYYAWKFSFMYMKRYLTVAVLIMMAPFVSVFYAYNKVRSGKAVVFTNWLKELFFMIILQSIHALLYVIFFRAALAISLTSIGGMILSFVMLHFMTQAEEIFRKIFNVQGNLTNDVSGSKLKDIGNAVKNIGMGTVGKKAAIATTKFAGRIVSKPYRALGDYGFGKLMEHRVNRFDNKIKKLEDKIQKRKNNNEEVSDEDIKEIERLKEQKETHKKKKDLYKAEEINRQHKLLLGELAKNLPDNKEELTDEQKKEIDDMRKRIPLKSSKNPGKNMDLDEYISNFYDHNNKNKKKFESDFDELTTSKAVFAHEVKKRWREITDPYQYVEKEKDENGNEKKDGPYRYKKTEREHENWGPILKHLSKKTDGASFKFSSNYMNTDYLLGLDKKQKDALKAFFNGTVKAELVGFSGILLGIPLVVAEPALGFGFLAKGISSSLQVKNTVFGTRAKRKNLKNMYMTADGKYHFIGYSGKAIETMGNGMLAAARENAKDVENSRNEYNREVVRRTKKHNKLYYKLTGGQKIQIGVGTTAATLGTIAAITATPATLVVGTIAAGTVLTGSVLQAIKPCAFVGMQDIIRTSRKKSHKDWKAELKSTDSLLNYMADRYYVVEDEKNEVTIHNNIENDCLEFQNAYEVAVESTIQSVETMDDTELLLETGYEDEIKVEKQSDGTKKITSDSEKELIDKAIVEIIAKSGIINIKDYDLSKDRTEQVKKVITERLIDKGIISKTQKAEDIIDDLDKKISEQKAELEATNPTAVEDKLLDDSIIEVMEEESIKKPSRVNKEAVMNRFQKKYQQMADTPSEESSKVLEGLEKQKKADTDSIQEKAKPKGNTEFYPISTSRPETTEVFERVESKVSDRIDIFDRKLKEKLGVQKKLNPKTRKRIEKYVIKKKIREIDSMINNAQIELNEKTSSTSQVMRNVPINGVTNEKDTAFMQSQQIGTFSSIQSDFSEAIASKSKSEDVVKLLVAQTQIQKDKERLVSLKERQKNRHGLYRAELNNPDGTINVSKFIQGSLVADSSKDGSRMANINMDGSILVNKSKDGSRSVGDKLTSKSSDIDLAVLEIMRRVKKEKNI